MLLLSQSINVEFSGGEPGLVVNLEEVLALCLSKKSISKTTLLSNGLAHDVGITLTRKTLLSEFEYIEHWIEPLKEPLNTLEDFKNNPRAMLLLVLDSSTIDVILSNPTFDACWKEVYLMPKVLTPKRGPITPILAKQTDLALRAFLRSQNISVWTKTEVLNQLRKLQSYHRPDNRRRITCATSSSLMYIDLENQTIGQCCVNVERSQKVDLSPSSLLSALRGEVFTPTPLCDECFKYA